MLLRPLYESWLLRSTTAPLAPWQRQLLLKALQRDERLRSLAMELAQFGHDEGAPVGLNPPDLRARLRMLAEEPAASAPARRPAWAAAGALVALLAGGLGWWWLEPAQQRVELARVEQFEEAALLRLPSATPTPSVTATASATPAISHSATPTGTATPSPSPSATPSRTATPTPSGGAPVPLSGSAAVATSPSAKP